jgi:hypothetical protein
MSQSYLAEIQVLPDLARSLRRAGVSVTKAATADGNVCSFAPRWAAEVLTACDWRGRDPKALRAVRQALRDVDMRDALIAALDVGRAFVKRFVHQQALRSRGREADAVARLEAVVRSEES